MDKYDFLLALGVSQPLVDTWRASDPGEKTEQSGPEATPDGTRESASAEDDVSGNGKAALITSLALSGAGMSNGTPTIVAEDDEPGDGTEDTSASALLPVGGLFKAAPALVSGPLAIKVKAPHPGTGIDFFDDSSITYTSWVSLSWQNSDGQQPNAINMKEFQRSTKVGIIAPGKGSVSLTIQIVGFEDNKFIKEYSLWMVAHTWQFTADAEGKLDFDSVEPRIETLEDGTSYQLSSVAPIAEKSHVQLNILIVGGSDGESSSHTASGSVGLGKGAEVGGELSGGSSRTKAPPLGQEWFRVDLNVVVPKKPEPKGTVTLGKATAFQTREFVIKPFKTGHADVLDKSSVDDEVKAILASINPENYHGLRQNRRAGEWNDGASSEKGELIEIDGFASNKDIKLKNEELSTQRAEFVRDTFLANGLDKSAFAPVAGWGESKSPPQEDPKLEFDNPDWRKVVIRIKDYESSEGE